jgi:hypothetical protein
MGKAYGPEFLVADIHAGLGACTPTITGGYYPPSREHARDQFRPDRLPVRGTANSVDHCSDGFDLDELIGIPEDGDA